MNIGILTDIINKPMIALLFVIVLAYFLLYNKKSLNNKPLIVGFSKSIDNFNLKYKNTKNIILTDGNEIIHNKINLNKNVKEIMESVRNTEYVMNDSPDFECSSIFNYLSLLPEIEYIIDPKIENYKFDVITSKIRIVSSSDDLWIKIFACDIEQNNKNNKIISCYYARIIA